VLVGDFLYSRAFQLMVHLDSMDILSILSDATNIIAEGEVLQLDNIGNADLSEEDYLEIVRCKTALLFQAAAHTAAVLSTDDPDLIEALRNYGLYFGMAFQLVDDWLDYEGDSEVMGKNVGDDLAEGKATLPLIYTIKHGTTDDAKTVYSALKTEVIGNPHPVIEAVRSSGALDYTKMRAEKFAELAINELAALPPNIHREALEALAGFAVTRMC
jgi:octaprenyl-diphosphate synthase